MEKATQGSRSPSLQLITYRDQSVFKCPTCKPHVYLQAIESLIPKLRTLANTIDQLLLIVGLKDCVTFLKVFTEKIIKLAFFLLFLAVLALRTIILPLQKALYGAGSHK